MKKDMKRKNNKTSKDICSKITAASPFSSWICERPLHRGLGSLAKLVSMVFPWFVLSFKLLINLFLIGFKKSRRLYIPGQEWKKNYTKQENPDKTLFQDLIFFISVDVHSNISTPSLFFLFGSGPPVCNVNRKLSLSLRCSIFTI